MASPKALHSPSDVDVSIQPLLYASDEEFEAGIRKLDVRDLLKLISCLQQEMAYEQKRFDRLSQALSDTKGEGYDATGPSSFLSSSLCQSQKRLTQLCNWNLRCFTQQAERARQDQVPFLLRKEDSAIATTNKDIILQKLQSPSSNEYRWSSWDVPSSALHHFPQKYTEWNDETSEQDDCEKDARILSSGTIKVQTPSVEDILENVRALRHEADEHRTSSDSDLDSESWRLTRSSDVSPTPRTSASYGTESTATDNECDLVPTATQLLLRTRAASQSSRMTDSEGIAGDWKNGEKTKQYHPEDNDSLCSYSSSDKSLLPEIRRSHLSCPNFLSSLSLPVTKETSPGPTSQDQSLANNDDEDDDDSGVGAEEQPKFGPRRRAQRRHLMDAIYQPLPSSAAPSMSSESVETPSEEERKPFSHSSTVHHNNNNDGEILRNAKRDQMFYNPKDDDDIIPSIIEQFMCHPLPEAEAFRRQKGPNVHWNPGHLLEELYRIPDPSPVAMPPVTFLNMEGYLEKLPSGRRHGTFWNAWKRRYFRLKDGYLHCYLNSKSEQPSFSMQLMGGKVDNVETAMLGIDDGKGHYVVVHCGNRAETERWRRALITHTAENYSLTYAQPVVPYPQFYEDVLIIDIGSCSVRAGILCNQPTLPQVYFPTVCAKDRTSGNTVYGKEALLPVSRFGATVTFPLRPSAKITKFTVDLQSVKGLLSKVFYELNVDPSDYQIQLSLPRSFPFQSQTEVLDLLMTEFGIRAVNLTAQTVLALCSYNTTSGVVVDIGERLEVIPIVDGYVIESGVSRIPYGGTRLLDHLRHFLMQHHYGLASETESFLLRYVLERACYCAENYNKELQKFYSDPQSFEMAIPVEQFFDGDAPWETISLDSGRFQAPEGLFNPDAWGLDNPGIQKLVSKAIQECSLDVRKEMSRSIYLSGGVTVLPGFPERLQIELDHLTPPAIFPKVHASPYRAHAAYLGACILASSSGFHQAKVTRDDWIANGSSCLKKWHF